jgi:hypothetical protein
MAYLIGTFDESRSAGGSRGGRVRGETGERGSGPTQQPVPITFVNKIYDCQNKILKNNR